MASELFYPHRTAPNALALDIGNLVAPLSFLSDGTIDAFSDAPSEVTIPVSVSLELDSLKEALPSGTSIDSEVRVLLVCRGVQARTRVAIDLAAPLGKWDHDLKLRRSEWTGSGDISVVAIRSRDGNVPAGFAADRGAILAWSETARVVFDEAEHRLGRTIEIKWVEFRHENGLNPDNLFALRAQAGKPPQILLNSRFPGAQILESRARRGRPARIRDAAFQWIVHQVWSSILASTWGKLAEEVASIEGVEDDSEEGLLDRLEPWQAGVLRDWARHLYPDAGDKETALTELIDAAKDKSHDDALMNRLSDAIQTRFKTYGALTGLLRDAHLFEE